MSRSLGQYQVGAEDKRTLHLGGGLKAERDIQKCMVASERLHGLTTQMFMLHLFTAMWFSTAADYWYKHQMQHSCIYLQQCGLVQHQTISTKCNTGP